MINGHTNGQYLDHPALYPFWERAEALGALIYLHPVDPVKPAPVLEGHKGLRRATWEWTFETGSHALRLIFSGLFDRFPRARLGLGHLGFRFCSGASTAARGRTSTMSSLAGHRRNISRTISW
jgi:2,3-dihydroxybenzoate decarboxylase